MGSVRLETMRAQSCLGFYLWRAGKLPGAGHNAPGLGMSPQAMSKCLCAPHSSQGFLFGLSHVFQISQELLH